MGWLSFKGSFKETALGTATTPSHKLGHSPAKHCLDGVGEPTGSAMAPRGWSKNQTAPKSRITVRQVLAK